MEFGDRLGVELYQDVSEGETGLLRGAVFLDGEDDQSLALVHAGEAGYLLGELDAIGYDSEVPPLDPTLPLELVERALDGVDWHGYTPAGEVRDVEPYHAP